MKVTNKAKVFEKKTQSADQGVEITIVREEVMDSFIQFASKTIVVDYVERPDLDPVYLWEKYQDTEGASDFGSNELNISLWVTSEESDIIFYELMASTVPNVGFNEGGGVYVGDNMWVYPDGSMKEY